MLILRGGSQIGIYLSVTILKNMSGTELTFIMRHLKQNQKTLPDFRIINRKTKRVRHN